MKMAVFSDTHGCTAGMAAAAARIRPDVLVHLGDYVRDAQALARASPELPLYTVCGNCDFDCGAPDTQEFLFGPVRVFAVHGHRYGVKYGTDSLLNAAWCAGAKLALYGHTHVPECREAHGLWLVNPGSAGLGTPPTFAVAEVNELGGLICRIETIGA